MPLAVVVVGVREDPQHVLPGGHGRARGRLNVAAAAAVAAAQRRRAREVGRRGADHEAGAAVAVLQKLSFCILYNAFPNKTATLHGPSLLLLGFAHVM